MKPYKEYTTVDNWNLESMLKEGWELIATFTESHISNQTVTDTEEYQYDQPYQSHYSSGTSVQLPPGSFYTPPEPRLIRKTVSKTIPVQSTQSKFLLGRTGTAKALLGDNRE